MNNISLIIMRLVEMWFNADVVYSSRYSQLITQDIMHYINTLKTHIAHGIINILH